MADEEQAKHESQADEFEARARRARKASAGPIAEFWYFLSRTGKWWMTPIIVALLLMGVLLVVGGTAVAPLIYTLF